MYNTLKGQTSKNIKSDEQYQMLLISKGKTKQYLLSLVLKMSNPPSSLAKPTPYRYSLGSSPAATSFPLIDDS